MSLDTVIAVLLGVVVLGTALLGGIARVVPPRPGNPVQVYIVLNVFLVFCGLLLIGWQSYRAQDVQRRADARAEGLAGQIRLLIERSAPPPTAAIAQPEQGPVRALNNAELKTRVIALANTMRDFENNFQSDELRRILTEPPLTGTEEEKNRQWQARTSTMVLRRQEYANEFRKCFLGEALAYRDELLRRLNIIAPEEERQVIALQGFLAGPTPVADLAAYLERLAKQLPQ